MARPELDGFGTKWGKLVACAASKTRTGSAALEYYLINWGRNSAPKEGRECEQLEATIDGVR